MHDVLPSACLAKHSTIYGTRRINGAPKSCISTLSISDSAMSRNALGLLPQIMAPSSGSAIPLFSDEVGEDVKLRLTLIPKIAKALSAWNNMVAHDKDTGTGTSIQTWTQDTSDTGNWIEEKLWLSMAHTLALNMDGSSSGGIMSMCSTTRNENTNTPAGDDPLQGFGDSTYDDGRPAPLADVAAERKNAPQHGTKPFKLPYQRPNHDCCAGVSSELFDRAISTIMHNPTATLTHIDQKGVWNQKISVSPNVIGREELIHCSYSTLPHEQTEHLEAVENNLIYENNRSPSLFLKHSIANEGFNGDTDLLSLTNDVIIATLVSTAFKESLVDTMDNSDSRQSLTDVLGDDMLLWSMWKRRPSTYPQGENDAELLHNMFENDPDMKLFSPTHEDEISYADIMMLDSWDFSRKSSNSSTTTTPDGGPSNSLEQLEQFPPRSYSSQFPPVSSTRDAKEQKRQPSVQKMATRSTTGSEDDMIFQQASPPRRVDIKSRRGVREHSGRR